MEPRLFRQANTPNIRRTRPEKKSANKKDLGFCILTVTKKGQPVSKSFALGHLEYLNREGKKAKISYPHLMPESSLNFTYFSQRHSPGNESLFVSDKFSCLQAFFMCILTFTDN